MKMKMGDTPTTYECPKCYEVFQKRRGLRTHISRQHNGRIYHVELGRKRLEDFLEEVRQEVKPYEDLAAEMAKEAEGKKIAQEKEKKVTAIKWTIGIGLAVGFIVLFEWACSSQTKTTVGTVIDTQYNAATFEAGEYLYRQGIYFNSITFRPDNGEDRYFRVPISFRLAEGDRYLLVMTREQHWGEWMMHLEELPGGP